MATFYRQHLVWDKNIVLSPHKMQISQVNYTFGHTDGIIIVFRTKASVRSYLNGSVITSDQVQQRHYVS